MNPAVLNNMRRLIVIDGYQVWYFERATKQTLRPYLTIAPGGNHFWVGWDVYDWFGVHSDPVKTFILNHATLAYPTA